jgi:hypothetical protein
MFMVMNCSKKIFIGQVIKLFFLHSFCCVQHTLQFSFNTSHAEHQHIFYKCAFEIYQTGICLPFISLRYTVLQ